MLVTVSDDHTVKIWRSRNLERQYKLKWKKIAALAREKREELPAHVTDPIPDPGSESEESYHDADEGFELEQQ